MVLESGMCLWDQFPEFLLLFFSHHLLWGASGFNRILMGTRGDVGY